jgi:hypothetical protein
MDAHKVEAKLRACFELAERSQNPVADTENFFEELSKDPAWSQDEIMELQALFIQSIIQRWRGSDKT